MILKLDVYLHQIPGGLELDVYLHHIPRGFVKEFQPLVE